MVLFPYFARGVSQMEESEKPTVPWYKSRRETPAPAPPPRSREYQAGHWIGYRHGSVMAMIVSGVFYHRYHLLDAFWVWWAGK
jgi:hypothetical protein